MQAQISNVDSPRRIECFVIEKRFSVFGVDNRKRGLRKMLDIKEHEE